jgi:hypothetical protein
MGVNALLYFSDKPLILRYYSYLLNPFPYGLPMDDFQEYGIPFERKFFLSRAKVRPAFLIRHLGSFSHIVLDRLKTKYYARLRGVHHGAKRRPKWLTATAEKTRNLDFTHLLYRIPQREYPALQYGVLPAVESIHLHLNPQPADAENYFAQFRWSELVDDMLGTVAPQDWRLSDKIIHWLQAPPVKSDRAWETYSACERVTNLITWISFIPAAYRLTSVPQASHGFLEDSLQWIMQHLEYYGKKTGNHILNNARALIMGGTVLNNIAAVQMGVSLLSHMLPVLIQRDGFLRERSSHYQMLIMQWLLDTNYFLQLQGAHHEFVAGTLKPQLEKMAQATQMLCNASGYLQAYIGDVSPDLAPVKTTQRLLRCYPDAWPQPVEQVSAIVARDDWWQLGAGRSKILLNCPAGPYPQSFSSHAHNDMTSFVWLHDEEAIFIDSGRSRYTKDPVSTLQKSARGHSLAFIDGFSPLCESMVINGNWWPSPYADASVHVDRILDNAISMTHNGFARATPVKRHQRKITLLDHQLCITDEFNGSGRVTLELLWQLSPAFMGWSHDALTVTNGNLQLQIDLSGMKNLPTLKFHAQSTARGWYSAEYGVATPNPVISMRWEIELPFTTRIIFKVRSCVA